MALMYCGRIRGWTGCRGSPGTSLVSTFDGLLMCGEAAKKGRFLGNVISTDNERWSISANKMLASRVLAIYQQGLAFCDELAFSLGTLQHWRR